jgi:hypothetical protein
MTRPRKCGGEVSEKTQKSKPKSVKEMMSMTGKSIKGSVGIVSPIAHHFSSASPKQTDPSFHHFTDNFEHWKNSFEPDLNDNFLQMSNPHYRGKKFSKLQNIGAGCRSQHCKLSGLHQCLIDYRLLLRHKYLYDNHRRKMFHLFQLSQSRPLNQTKSRLILDRKYREKISQILQWANFEFSSGS